MTYIKMQKYEKRMYCKLFLLIFKLFDPMMNRICKTIHLFIIAD